MVTIDAKNGIAGRIAALVAKELLKGNEVNVINAENAFISGNPEKVVEVYYKRRQMTNKANPETATKWSRKPDLFFKKMITGMLPKHTSRQATALDKLRVYVGVPKSLEADVKTAQKPQKTVNDLKGRVISIKDVCERLGYKIGV